MSDALEVFFATPIPETVWHYTSIAALEGILSSGRIWATEAHHTTDMTEFVHLRSVANAFLAALETTTVPDREAKRAAMSIVDMVFTNGPLSPEHTEVFIASFSSAEDLKSQWVDYADRSRGVSIAFDMSRIRPTAKEDSAVTFAPCIYDKGAQEALLTGALTHVMQVVRHIHKQTQDEAWVATHIDGWDRVDQIFGETSSRFDRQLIVTEKFRKLIRPAAIRTSYALLRLASHCKHHAYFEEKEWRLALPHKTDKPMLQNKIEYRDGPSLTPIPYVAHKVGNDRLPIKSVMLGPLNEQRHEVEKLLSKYGYEVPVLTSSIPARVPTRVG